MDPISLKNLMSMISTLVLPTEVCMDELGCFKYVPPYIDIGIARIHPFDRKVIDTKFYLYTPENANNPLTFSNLYENISSISTSSYNPNVVTHFVVGGFLSGSTGGWKTDMVDALIRYRGHNVFLVDWDKGDDDYNYAVANTRVVGAEIALFIQRLQNIVGLQPDNVHIIGHSLGAHIAGFAGKRLQNLGSITGLDPAGPAFTNVDPKERLDKNDALFVDVIHTDMSSTVLTGFGLMESIGHFDYFPNGGRRQPGCEDLGSLVLSFITFPNPYSLASYRGIECSHSRALYLFIQSIKNTTCTLWGTVCSSWDNYAAGNCGSCNGEAETCIPLGLDADVHSSKINGDQSVNIFLETTDRYPYC